MYVDAVAGDNCVVVFICKLVVLRVRCCICCPKGVVHARDPKMWNSRLHLNILCIASNSSETSTQEEEISCGDDDGLDFLNQT